MWGPNFEMTEHAEFSTNAECLHDKVQGPWDFQPDFATSSVVSDASTTSIDSSGPAYPLSSDSNWTSYNVSDSGVVDGHSVFEQSSRLPVQSPKVLEISHEQSRLRKHSMSMSPKLPVVLRTKPWLRSVCHGSVSAPCSPLSRSNNMFSHTSFSSPDSGRSAHGLRSNSVCVSPLVIRTELSSNSSPQSPSRSSDTFSHISRSSPDSAPRARRHSTPLVPVIRTELSSNSTPQAPSTPVSVGRQFLEQFQRAPSMMAETTAQSLQNNLHQFHAEHSHADDFCAPVTDRNIVLSPNKVGATAPAAGGMVDYFILLATESNRASECNTPHCQDFSVKPSVPRFDFMGLPSQSPTNAANGRNKTVAHALDSVGGSDVENFSPLLARGWAHDSSLVIV